MSSEDENKKFHVENEHKRFYDLHLYDLLPDIYHERDVKNTLKQFLEIIGDQASEIHQNIDELWSNFYIDTCDEWVIPYIGDLVGKKTISSPAAKNRLEVKKAVRLNKLKGTLTGIDELAKYYFGPSKSVEFFNLCLRTQNLRNDSLQDHKNVLVDVRNSGELNKINSPEDPVSHVIDVRHPALNKGRYNPQSIGVFVSDLNIYHVEDFSPNVECKNQFSFGIVPNFKPGRLNHLYDKNESDTIDSHDYSSNPEKYFGNKNAFSIKIRGILAATSSKRTPVIKKKEISDAKLLTISALSASHAEKENSDFVELDPSYGIRLPGSSPNSPEKEFTVSLFSQLDDGQLIEIARYDTSRKNDPQFYLLSDVVGTGKMIIGVELNDSSNPMIFSETTLAIKDSRIPFVDVHNLKRDSLDGKYKNALYVYLPEIDFFARNKDMAYFFVDVDGSTYFAKEQDNRIVIDDSQPPRISEGQVYPPRILTYSLEELQGFAELNRFDGLSVLDTSVFENEFTIEAIAVNNSNKSRFKIGELFIDENNVKYTNGDEVWIRWKLESESNQNEINTSGIEWTTHFKSVRRSSDLFSAENCKRAGFADILQGSHDERESALESLSWKILDNFENEIDSIGCKLTKALDLSTNCTEFAITISLRELASTQLAEIINSIKNEISDDALFDNTGTLTLKIKSKTKETPVFPMSSILLKNNSNKSILAYIPEIHLEKNNSFEYLHVASDGSTFHRQLSPDDLARKSMGQIFPIYGTYPIQHRIASFVNLRNWDKQEDILSSGLLGIDPGNGRFVFSIKDGDVNDLSVDFNYGFTHNVGAGSYDVIPYQNEWFKKIQAMQEKEHALKPPPSNYKWVTKAGHDSGPNLLPSKTFMDLDDVLSNLADGDVVEIVDNSEYEIPSSIKIPKNVKNLTIQCFSQNIPKITTQNKEEITIEGDLDSLNLYGLMFNGVTLRIIGSVKNLTLGSCTIQPKDSKGLRVASIEFISKTTKKQNIFLFNSIIGGIVLDGPSFQIGTFDSIIENFDGSAISNSDSSMYDTNNIDLVAERSNVLSKDWTVLHLNTIRCSDSIFTGKIFVDQREHENNWIRYSRYEAGSKLPVIRINGKLSHVAFKCTTDLPIFVSRLSESSHYMCLDDMCSQQITAGGENSLSMGVYNKSYSTKQMEILKTRLKEYIPFGKKLLLYKK